MSTLLKEISEQLTSAGKSLDNGYTSLKFGSVVKVLIKIQDEALALEAEKESYRVLLETIIKHSSAEDIIKKQCEDALNKFNKGEED